MNTSTENHIVSVVEACSPWSKVRDIVPGVVQGSDLAFEASICVRKVVRVLVPKRVVAQATWGEKPVYLKCFFGTDAQRYATRDAQGSQLLINANIETPKLLARYDWQDGVLLIFEEISPSINFENLWRNANFAQQLKLVHRLIKLVATQHNAGLIHTDLHFNNFITAVTSVEDLLTSDSEPIYTIDGDGIRETKSHTRFLHNLAGLLAKIDTLQLQLHGQAFWQTYITHCKFTPKFSKQTLAQIVLKQRYKQLTEYAGKKVFRPCSEVWVDGNPSWGWTDYYARRRIDDLRNFPTTAKSLEKLICNGSILKSGNTATVVKIQHAGLYGVVKRYNIKHLQHAISRGLRKSRALHSWGNAFRLQMAGILTPNPWAVLEERYLGWRGRAYFVTEYIDAPDLNTFFMQSKDKVLRAKVVRSSVELLYRLYCLRISHGDFKASNIKVLADGRVMLIDLDSMYQHQLSAYALNAHVGDLKRFMRNWEQGSSLYKAYVKIFNVVYAEATPLVKADISNRSSNLVSNNT